MVGSGLYQCPWTTNCELTSCTSLLQEYVLKGQWRTVWMMCTNPTEMVEEKEREKNEFYLVYYKALTVARE